MVLEGPRAPGHPPGSVILEWGVPWDLLQRRWWWNIQLPLGPGLLRYVSSDALPCVGHDCPVVVVFLLVAAVQSVTTRVIS